MAYCHCENSKLPKWRCKIWKKSEPNKLPVCHDFNILVGLLRVNMIKKIESLRLLTCCPALASVVLCTEFLALVSNRWAHAQQQALFNYKRMRRCPKSVIHKPISLFAALSHPLTENEAGREYRVGFPWIRKPHKAGATAGSWTHALLVINIRSSSLNTARKCQIDRYIKLKAILIPLQYIDS